MAHDLTHYDPREDYDWLVLPCSSLSVSDPNDDKSDDNIAITIKHLRETAKAAEQGLSTVYLPGEGFKTVDAESEELLKFLPEGQQKIVNLAEDLMLARSEFHDIPEEAQSQKWSLDFQGWLFLHFRLEGVSREIRPDGQVTTLGGQSFLLSAAQGGPGNTREVLGDSWRTVGIACKPSFIQRELRLVHDDLPEDLQRFQDGDPEIELWYAGDLTPEMSAVANALLHPSVHKSVRPIYLRAKAVELVCLAIDRLRQPEQVVSSSVKLNKYDISCLHFAKQILDESRKPPKLDELARRVGVNRNKLAVGFKHVFGMTVGGYHRELRLQRAYSQLQDSDMTVGRIADEAGYRDAGSFSKAFKQRYGILPSDFRAGPDGVGSA